MKQTKDPPPKTIFLQWGQSPDERTFCVDQINDDDPEDRLVEPDSGDIETIAKFKLAERARNQTKKIVIKNTW